MPPISSFIPPLRGVDCPDSLARCEGGAVSVSRLATVPEPCRGPPGTCDCPWEVLGECPRGCAADGVQLVVERAWALRQLCAPTVDAGAFVVPVLPSTPSPRLAPSLPSTAPSRAHAPAPAPTPAPALACDEGDRYRCDEGKVVECQDAVAIGRCADGCFANGTSIDDDGVSREAAFAILCSR